MIIKLKEEEYADDLEVNGRVMLKQVLKKQCTLPWV
jgi:hypothetical protein